MWNDHALPLLRERGLGTEVAARTYRLTGIGESQVAERLGETLLRATNPIVATYARSEAVDIRISARADPPRTAEQLVEDTSATVMDLVGEHIWSTGETTWSEAIGSRLEALGWTLAAVEIGTAGSFGAMLGDAGWLRFDETISPDAPAARSHEASTTPHGETAAAHGDPDASPGDTSARHGAAVAHGDAEGDDLLRFARRARELGGSEIGVAIRARPRTGDTAVMVAVSTPTTEHKVRRVVFLTGPLGRSRSALAAAAVVLETLNAAAEALKAASAGLADNAPATEVTR
jgi:hypothetical protein